MNWNAVWIQPEHDMGDVVPVYEKQFSLSKMPVRQCFTSQHLASMKHI